MDKYHRLKGQRLLALFFLGCLLFNYPVLAIFVEDKFIWGIPNLYICVFTSWIALIGLTAFVIERK